MRLLVRQCCDTKPLWGALFVLLLAPFAFAQQVPHIGYVYPAGGKQGTTFQVTVGGQYVQGATDVHISGTGVRATIVESERPLTVQQAQTLRDKLNDLRDKKAASFAVERSTTTPSTRPVYTAEDQKMFEEIVKKLANFVPPNQLNPAIAERVTIQVTIDATAVVGERDLRLKTPNGFSNPMLFCVGDLPEVGRDAARPLGGPAFRNGPAAAPSPAEMSVTLPATINGQIMPGTVHRYRFTAHRGEHLVAVVQARSLIPYLADAVPGWFQATLALYDAKGKELAYDDHYRFSPDPVLYYAVPQDGQYVIEIHDSIYRGREDFVYRISIGQLPFVTSVYPLGTQVGQPTTVTLSGWNLPTTTITTTPREAGLEELASVGKTRPVNRVFIEADTLPECADQSPNDRPETAQAVTLPVIINGRIAEPGQQHVYRFEGHAGQSIVAEVNARRLGSPLDSLLRLTDAHGKQLAVNDDAVDKGAGLLTHQADSLLTATLPAGGTYYLYLSDTQGHGGSEFGYRLRLSTPRPDYELRVTPSSINARAGTSAPLTVYALRRDGFAGEITLTLKDAPPGFVLKGATIPAKQDQAKVTLTIPPSASKEPFSPHIEGHALFAGRDVVRPVQPAEDMMQAFAYHHLVPAQDLLVSVFNGPAIQNPIALVETTPVRIALVGPTKLHLVLPRAVAASQGIFELTDPPPGIGIQSVTQSADSAEIVLKCEPGKIKVGTKGNLIIAASIEREVGQIKGKGQKRRIPLGAMPAIPFVIVER